MRIGQAIAGFADWLQLSWGTPLWRTATAHAVANLLAGALFLGAMLSGHDDFKAGNVTTGPFVLTDYVPGQHLVFSRNPRYWRQDANGTALPYLDRLTVEIIPDQDAELLRLDSSHDRARAHEMAQTRIAALDATIKELQRAQQ